jgi:hypothetical protein
MKEKEADIQWELKRMNRFIIQFPEEFNISEWSVQTANKPKFVNGKWENITIGFTDPIGPSTSQGLMNIVYFLKEKNTENKKIFDIVMEMFDPTGVVVEKWDIGVGKILVVDFGELDCQNDDIQRVSITFEPTSCTLRF